VPHPRADLFRGAERSSVDTMLRNTQQQLVALSGQADLKASLLITASAVVASVAASQISDSLFGWAAGTLLVWVLGAMLAGVFAILPKFSVHREPEARCRSTSTCCSSATTRSCRRTVTSRRWRP
jgi:hypothetical protein